MKKLTDKEKAILQRHLNDPKHQEDMAWATAAHALIQNATALVEEMPTMLPGEEFWGRGFFGRAHLMGERPQPGGGRRSSLQRLGGQKLVSLWRRAAHTVEYQNIRSYVTKVSSAPPSDLMWQSRIRCYNIHDWIEQGEPRITPVSIYFSMFAATSFMAFGALAMGWGRR